ncbi:DUF4238 domain-containing protein [Prevotella pectinovora]|uniref:DUF4238 domain-containing protein n=1 Tax=Prevotella pectinovora TaxID=1602169 RepID=UPI00307C7413
MKQHYIPRCYLKRFSENKKSIYTYDKQHSKKYNASLMSVCCEDDIYTFSEEFVKRNKEEGNCTINRLSIETDHFAHTVEPLYIQLLNQINKIKEEWVTGKDHYTLNFYEKKELALHIVTQYFRLPQIGDTLVDNYIRMERASIDMMKELMAKQTNNDDYKKIKINPTCEKPALHANLSYLDNETLMMFANAIANNIFVFWISKGNDFYTSDFPIVVSPHVKNVRPMFMGLAQYGGELTMPLSPGLALSVYDRSYFKNKEDIDGAFVNADDKEVRRQNYLRYMYATQHVFSYKNDFSLIDFIYELEGAHPFWSPNYRAEIVSGLGKY